jgi:hypothetical protein
MGGAQPPEDATVGSVPLAEPSSPGSDSSWLPFETSRLLPKPPEAPFARYVPRETTPLLQIEASEPVLEGAGLAVERSRGGFEPPNPRAEEPESTVEGPDWFFEAPTLVFERRQALSLDSTPVTKTSGAHARGKRD